MTMQRTIDRRPERARKRRTTPAREAGQRVIEVVAGMVRDGVVTPKQIAQATQGDANGCPVSKIINEGREPLCGFLVALANNLDNDEARHRVRALLVDETRVVVPEQVAREFDPETFKVLQTAFLLAQEAGTAGGLVMKLDDVIKNGDMTGNNAAARREILRQGPEIVQQLKKARGLIDQLGAWIDHLQSQAIAFRRAQSSTGLRLADDAIDTPASDDVNQVDPRADAEVL